MQPAPVVKSKKGGSKGAHKVLGGGSFAEENGIDEGNEKMGNNDVDEDGQEKMNYVKAKKIKEFLAAGKVEPAVVSLWEDACLMKGNGMQQKKTQIVNRYFNKVGKNFVTVPEHPMFKEVRVRKSGAFGK